MSQEITNQQLEIFIELAAKIEALGPLEKACIKLAIDSAVTRLTLKNATDNLFLKYPIKQGEK